MRLRILSFVCVATLLAGCGGTTIKSATTGPTVDDSSSLPVPTFPADSTMERLQQDGKINVGTSYTQGAFSSRGETSTLSGFDIQLAQYIAQAIFGGTRTEAAGKINYVQAEADNRQTFLANSTIDIALGAYEITPARQQVIDFAGPYYAAKAQALVKTSDTRTQSISDLNGRNVCLPSSLDLQSDLVSAAPQVNVVPKSTLQQCQDALTAGSVDAIAGYDWQLAPVVQANPQWRILTNSFATANYGVGITQGDTTFRQFLNTTLQKLEDDKQWQAAFASTLGAAGVAPTTPPAIDNSVPSPSLSTGYGATTTSTANSSTTSTTVIVTPTT